MYVLGIAVDLNWLIQFIVSAIIVAFGLLHLVRNTASKYFAVDADFNDHNHTVLSSSSDRRNMPGILDSPGDSCVVCGKLTTKQCSGCKLVKYCSESCQRSHWISGHKTRCKDLAANGTQSAFTLGRRKLYDSVSLVPSHVASNHPRKSKKILFPYEDFVEYFNWDKPGFPPCGLLNCGNSCFVNVVLQCLTYTRPLIAYLLQKGHRQECGRNDWCFLCEFQTHVERSSQNPRPFSPFDILSRLTNIGGNLGYGRQEDAHEFMRFAIDTMQSVCLDEFGGERAVSPRSAETTLIQHIFGGHLQSQVICSKCNNVSCQSENMMDLTVEIQGDAESLEKCLCQFTAREQLHGDNMYKCDGCNEYVVAWKSLTIRRAPNILTIALKRFQSGRFGKLNKRVTFPETLDLSRYMSHPGDGNDVYKLYAVVVHLDMLNASFFGHYICYVKDFRGNWYLVDDCKVQRVDLDEVLSQGAYMLLYSRVCARPSSLYADEHDKEEQEMVEVQDNEERIAEQPVDWPSDNGSQVKVTGWNKELASTNNFQDVREVKVVEDAEVSPCEMMDVDDFPDEYVNAEVEVSPAEDVHGRESGVASGACTSPSGSNFLKDKQLSSSSNFMNENGASAKECILFDSPSNKPLMFDSDIFDKGATSQNGSINALGSVETPENMAPVNYDVHKSNVENGQVLPSSSGTKYAAERSIGREVKMRPLFTPGFLAKPKRNKVMLVEGQSTAELKELGFSTTLGKRSNGFSKGSLCCQNDGVSKDNENLCFESKVSSPSVIPVIGSGESVDLSNVDSVVPGGTGKGAIDIVTDDEPLVVEQTAVHTEE